MHYENFKSSILRFCTQFATDMQAQGLASMMPINFDAHADINELPESDLIGPKEFGVETDQGTFVISTMIGVSTLNDTNLFRLDKIIDQLFKRLMPDEMIPLVNAETGAQMGWMKAMNGTAVLPVVQTKTRPLKFVAVSLGTDRLIP